MTETLPPKNHNGEAVAQLRAVVDRILRLREEARAIAEDIKEVYVEAKSGGYDVRALRIAVRDKEMDAEERAEKELVQDRADGYLVQLG